MLRFFRLLLVAIGCCLLAQPASARLPGWMSKARAHEWLAQRDAPVDSVIGAMLSLAEIWSQSKPDSALYWVQEAEQYIEQHDLPSYRAWTDFQHGNALFFSPHHPKADAIPWFQKAAHRFWEQENFLRVSYAYRRLGKTYMFQSQPDSAEAYYMKALHVVRAHRASILSFSEQALDLSLLMVELYQTQGQLDQAVAYADSVEKYLEAAKTPKHRILAHLPLAGLYQLRDEVPLALAQLALARELLDSVDNEPLLVIAVLSRQSTCYSVADFIDSAISCGLKGLAVAEDIQSPRYISRLKLELAGLYSLARNRALARSYREEAIAMLDSSMSAIDYVQFLALGMAQAIEQSDEELYVAFDSLAQGKEEMGGAALELVFDFFRACAKFMFAQDHAAALAAFRDVEQSPASIPRIFSEDQLWYMMGTCHLWLKQPAEALKMADRITAQPEKQLTDGDLENVSFLRMQAWQQLGDMEQAQQAAEQYQTVLEKKMETKFAVAIQMAETRYRTDKIKAERDLQTRERQLAEQSARQNLQLAGLAGGGLIVVGLLSAFLFRSRERQRKLTAEVAQQRDRNEVLLRELNHRVKNNLQQISGLLMLQGRQAPQQETKDALKVSRQRMETMSMLHTMLYQGEDVGEINLRDYLSQLTHQLLGAYGYPASRIELDLSLADLSVNVDHGISLGLIANEWITNALKYALPHAPYLRVSLQLRDAHTAELIVADRGPGLPAGFDPMAATSYGLQLVQTMSEQMYGEVLVYREGGTQWRLRFGVGG